jgi:phytoene dehydrogenase-like protein
MAPPGKTAVVVSHPASFEAWRTLCARPAIYLEEKQCLASEVIAALDRRWPGFGKDVEVIDVATPVTYHRYTANWNGSMEGWAITTRSLTMRMSDTVPGLAAFHMVGQWVQPGGGLPPSAMSGRNVIRKLCEQQGKAFQTSEP